MKKIFAAFLILAIVFCLPACRKNNLAGKNTYEYEGIIVAMPDDFHVSKDDSTVKAYPDSYPEVSDNITFSCGGKDYASNYDKKAIEDLYKTNELIQQSGLTFSGITRYETGKIGNHDLIIVTYGVQYGTLQMMQSQAWVFLDTKTPVVTYTSSSGTYDDDFEFSIKNIALA